MSGYLAGWNLAGYLPETEPEHFDTLEEAVSYLRDTVERWQDEDWTEPDVDSKTADQIVDSFGDGWYKDIHLWVAPHAN